MQTLPVSRLVTASISLTPQAAVGRNFGDLLTVGDSNVISGLERIRNYADIGGVGADFGINTPEFISAELYFSQSPRPTSLSIGRWIRTATAGILQGAILSATQSALSVFTAITSGGFSVTIDGTAVPITGLDFSTQLNLNGVASVIQAALGGSRKCVWTGSQFEIFSGTTGAGVEATGTIAMTTNPANNDTVTVNGIAITFVTASPTGNEVLIGGTAAQTAVNLNTFLQASISPNIQAATYSVVTNVVSVTYGTPGTAGNAFTLAETGGHITVSGANLTGGTNPSTVSYATPPGSGQDISTILGMTAALALPLVPGYAAETPLQAVVALDAISTGWYGLDFAASVMPSDSDNLAIAPFIEADAVTRLFGITIQNTNALSMQVTNDLGSELKALAYDQTFTQFSTYSPYAVTSMFGRLFSVNFEAQNTMIDLMYKQEPGIVAENLDTNEANALQFKRINVYVAYDNNTSILQYGTMAGPAYIDEIFGCDWFQNAVQTACFNVNYTSPTKVPQTDSGSNQYVNAISGVCQKAVTNGFAAPGQWNAPGFGSLIEGAFLKLGYYIFAPPISSQSEADREARESVPIQTALKLAGSTQTVGILLNVNP